MNPFRHNDDFVEAGKGFSITLTSMEIVSCSKGKDRTHNSIL